MDHISNGVLYTSGIKLAEVVELNRKSIKKLILKKEIGGFSTFCIKGGKKKDLKQILECEEIKRMIEAKNIEVTMRYYKYKYLIFHLQIGYSGYEDGIIMSELMEKCF